MQIRRLPRHEKIHVTGPLSFALREFDLPAFDHGWHQHPEVELTWILEGSGLRHVGDSVEPFGPGDFCLIGANLPHMWSSPPRGAGNRARSFVIQFDPARFGDAFRQLPEMARINQLLAEAAHGICFGDDGASLRQLMEQCRTPIQHLTRLLEVLDSLVDHPRKRQLSLAPWHPVPNRKTDPRVERALAFIAQRWDQPLSQAQVAMAVGLSPAAFSRFFRRHVGRTFQAYLTEMRMSFATRELLETDRTISEIAFAAGFANLSNFNRAFRAIRGMSPREFRRRSLAPA
ncbi:MAG: AraC family transcriptional regulator [Verrucomicrobia bacterium]|nr:MAG: AraC family transcriptional regulator [Verrucomicrobiota bacterium]